jgi:hypothetical protein
MDGCLVVAKERSAQNRQSLFAIEMVPTTGTLTGRITLRRVFILF